MCLPTQGKYGEAEVLVGQYLTRFKAEVGTEHPDVDQLLKFQEKVLRKQVRSTRDAKGLSSRSRGKASVQ